MTLWIVFPAQAGIRKLSWMPDLIGHDDIYAVV